MNLKQLKEKFEKLNDDVILEYGLSDVFSWRGSYNEVCFSIDSYVTVKACKDLIERAYNETFWGYKGGEFKYTDKTPVNFEGYESAYTDGEFRESTIAKIINQDVIFDRDEYLVDLLVKS